MNKQKRIRLLLLPFTSLKHHSFALSFLLFLIGCSDNKEVKIIKKIHVKSHKEIVVQPTHEMNVEIIGMMCEMGCGGNIRKELKATGHVARVQFDFVEGRKIQVARIEYNAQKLTKESILTLIETLNDGQFKTKLLTDKALEIKSFNTVGNEARGNQLKGALLDAQESRNLELPSLLQIISSIL